VLPPLLPPPPTARALLPTPTACPRFCHHHRRLAAAASLASLCARLCDCCCCCCCSHCYDRCALLQTSKVFGVSWDKSRGMWEAKSLGTRLGRYKDEADAVAAMAAHLVRQRIRRRRSPSLLWRRCRHRHSFGVSVVDCATDAGLCATRRKIRPVRSTTRSVYVEQVVSLLVHWATSWACWFCPRAARAPSETTRRLGLAVRRVSRPAPPACCRR
jgi:hypothetical protein